MIRKVVRRIPHIPSSEITPKSIYLDRRAFLSASAVALSAPSPDKTVRRSSSSRCPIGRYLATASMRRKES